MEKQIETLSDILDSDLFNEIFDIEQENKDLADAGWTRKDIAEMAKVGINK